MKIYGLHFMRVFAILALVCLHPEATLAAEPENKAPAPEVTPDKEAGAEPSCFAIVGTNDLHGAVEPQTIQVGNEKVLRGGILTVSGYIEVLRNEFGER